MEGRLSSSPLISDQEEYENTTESGHESPPSTVLHDMKTTSTSSRKRSKRGMRKRVVSVPMKDVNSTPPSDSWDWRKYGQKPVKGSPYPRGYYRCSSSKGCPARKHVERSNVDPTLLVVTYTSEHNHPDRPSHPNTPTREPRIDYNPEENKFADLGWPDESSVSLGHNHPDRPSHPNTPTREPRIDYNPEENKFADLGWPDESSVSLGDEFGWLGGMETAPCAMWVLETAARRTGAASEADVSVFFQSRNLSARGNASNDDQGRVVCVSTGAEEELVDCRAPGDFPLGHIAGRRLPVQYLRKPVDHFLLRGPSRLRAPNVRPECLMEVYLPGSNNALLQDLVNLKHLDLSCSSLVKMPDLSRDSKLQSLDLRGCDNLVDVSSVQYLTRLKYINLKGCTSLTSLPSLMALKILCSLDVSDCSNLRRLPPSLGCLSILTTLDLRNCKRIQNLPKGILRLKSLQTLFISGCSMLMEHASRVPTPTFGPEGMLIEHQENPSSLHTSAAELSTSYQPVSNYATKIPLHQTQEERICNKYNSTGLEDATKPSSTTLDLERHREVLKGYMSMPMEAIYQANAFYDVQRTVESLNQQSSHLHECASLQDLSYCLEELQENVPETVARMHDAQGSKSSFQATLANLGSSFVQAEEHCSLLAAQFLAISDQEEELDAEIERLLAKRQELLD